MNELDDLLSKIPIEYDLYSSVIFSGCVVGFILCVVLFLRSDKSFGPPRIFAWLLFIVFLLVVDMFLCYTGLMKNVLHFNDLTEPISLFLGPLLYLYIRSILERREILWKWDIIHLILPLSYAITQIGYYISPLESKYNAYKGAYHPDLPFIDVVHSNLYEFSLAIKDQLRWYILISLFVYIVLSIRSYLLSRDQVSIKEKSKRRVLNRFHFTVILLLIVAVLLFTILSVFLNFEDDLGDHYIAIFFSISIFIIAAFIMSESRFFEKSWIADKYSTSGIDHVESSKLFSRIEQFILDEQYFLNNKTSLKDLSDKLSIPSNYISQSINREKSVNFSEYINSFRIEEAVRRLKHEDYAHFSIASIGESVGFNSKTTFYTAFKKQTGQTPSNFINS